MDAAAIEVEAQTLSMEIGEAIERVLDAAEAALRRTRDAEAQAGLRAIIEACAIGDIAAQRLTRIGRLARGEPPGAGLLNGPAAPGGGGLDQDAADRLMAFD